MAETDSFTLVQLPGLLWHWLTDPEVVSVFLVVLATMTANFVARRLLDQLARRIESTRTIWDDALLNAARQPLTLTIWVLGISWLLSWWRPRRSRVLERSSNPSDTSPLSVLSLCFCIGLSCRLSVALSCKVRMSPPQQPSASCCAYRS